MEKEYCRDHCPEKIIWHTVNKYSEKTKECLSCPVREYLRWQKAKEESA